MLIQIQRVQAVGGEQRVRVRGAQFADTRPAGGIHGGHYHLADPGVAGALQHLGAVGIEGAVVKMDVAVGKHGRDVSLVS
ncbi:hypothetical protein GCM10028797_26420 [Dyella agri]